MSYDVLYCCEFHDLTRYAGYDYMTASWHPRGPLHFFLIGFYMRSRQLLFFTPWRLDSSFSVVVVSASFARIACLCRVGFTACLEYRLMGQDGHTCSHSACCCALCSLCSAVRHNRLCVSCSDDGRMDTLLEIHLDPLWWRFSEGLCWRMGSRGLFLWTLWSGSIILLEGSISAIPPVSRLLRREQEQLRVILSFKAYRPLVSTCTEGRRLERFAWDTISTSISL